MIQEEVIKKAMQSFIEQTQKYKKTPYTITQMYFEQLFSLGMFYGRKQNKATKRVYQYKNGIYVQSYRSLTLTALIMGVPVSTMHYVIKKNKELKGSTFSYYKRNLK